VDEPFADGSILPTYCLAKMTRRHVTVALSGDGGDETFGGYTRYLVGLRNAYPTPLPRPARKLAGTIGERLPDWVRGKRRLRWLNLSPEERYLDGLTYFDRVSRAHLFAPSFRAALEDADRLDSDFNAMGDVGGGDILRGMQYLDFASYLPSDILVKVDRASMWTSLEVRAPFLDHRLVEFALSLPAHYHVGHTGKLLLKRAMRGLLPEVILDRPKMGFGMPLDRWFRTSLRGFARSRLDSPSSRIRGT